MFCLVFQNAQLQFIRMLCANRRRLNNGPHYMYFILLEAMDGGELKVYQAHVSPDFTGGMSLQFLGRIVEKGSPVKLFDPLGKCGKLLPLILSWIYLLARKNVGLH